MRRRAGTRLLSAPDDDARRKGKKLNKAWLHDHLTDPYVKLAQREGYRARAAYKLKEIDEQLHLLEPGQLVVDLGAVPGAWSQYVRRKFGRGASADPTAPPGPLHGTIVALDMLEFEPIDGVDFIAGDFREAAVLAELEARARRPAGRRRPLGHGAEPVGRRRVRRGADGRPGRAGDRFRAAPPAPGRLPRLQGLSRQRLQSARRTLQGEFRVVKAIKPKASRAKSAETFLVGIGLKPRCIRRRYPGVARQMPGAIGPRHRACVD